ncbi:MAG: STAS domain-containing protein, partial [Candidatus Aminicenantes bacterium]|nr:STAS domain-containing protein [Candidatus Aminicenantes bacterium]
MLKVTKEKFKDVYILRPEGKLVIGDEVGQFREALNEILEEGAKKIVVDLSKLTYMDSTGLGELVRSYTTVKKNGGMLKLASMTEKVKDLMFMTKLLTVFENFDTVEE